MHTNIFDTWSERCLLALGFIKLVLVLTFFMTFAGASHGLAANAEAAVCGGEDLIEKLQREDPAELAKIREEAKEVINSDSILWKIEASGKPDSWLFGTMHMADPEITKLHQNAENALASAQTIVVESTDALDPAAATNAMIKLAHLTLLGPEENLSKMIDPDLTDELEAATAARQLPMPLVNRMQPWLVATTVSLPVCELLRKHSGALVLDQVIAAHAEENNKELLGLETIEEQFSAIASLPQDYHLTALEETLALGTGAEDVIETMKVLYKRGEIGLIFPLMRSVSPKSFSGEGAENFQQALIENRNRTMAERVRPMLEKGSAFIAIGALHLPGETGLVALLKQAGYTVLQAE